MFKKFHINGLLDKIYTSQEGSADYYIRLKRIIVTTMMLLVTLPLAIMLIVNHFQYRSHLRSELISPILTMANKTKHSFELLLEARLSTVRFIATAYTFEELNDEHNIKRILSFLKNEFGGFVDLGLIDSNGIMKSYAGPYPLRGKNYSDQISFQETIIKGKYISNVFLGHRKFPHIVVAVQRLTDDGQNWVLRATIDTDQFDNLIHSMGLYSRCDAFLVNENDILQTNSRFYGKTLEKCPFDIPNDKFESNIIEAIAPDGQKVMIASAGFSTGNYTLVLIKPQSVVLQSWYALKTELFIVFSIGFGLILLCIIQITNNLVRRLKESDEKREHALEELQHNQKLSSIGRLSAGVAHEINNPLAIINEKAGLINDLLEYSEDFSHREKFKLLISSIIQSVDRCRTITHRLLGFAKRIEVKIEAMDLNTTVKEVLGFLKQEALYRKIDIQLDLLKELNLIESDKGQIQQVLLNLLTNAVAAVDDGGIIKIQTSNIINDGIMVVVSDNGCGISDDIISRIFDPFFSTRKEKGTGLGLSISYGIIEKLGGTINVSSQVGHGTSFTLNLPKTAEQNNEDDKNIIDRR